MRAQPARRCQAVPSPFAAASRCVRHSSFCTHQLPLIVLVDTARIWLHASLLSRLPCRLPQHQYTLCAGARQRRRQQHAGLRCRAQRGVVILPGLGNNKQDYEPLAQVLRQRGLLVDTAQVSRFDWGQKCAGPAGPCLLPWHTAAAPGLSTGAPARLSQGALAARGLLSAAAWANDAKAGSKQGCMG